MKTGLIYQPGGLGDILFLQKVAYDMKDKGYEVYWPVMSELEWLNDYIPDFNFISWGDVDVKLSRPPLPDTVQFPFKEHYLPEKKTEITDDLYYFQGFIDCRPTMAGKYNSIGMDWRDWRDYVKFTRKKEKEDRLFYDVLGLKDGEEYVLVNRTFCIRPHPMLCENIPNSPEYYGCKVVEMSIMREYSLFDWFKVFANAREIVTTETAINYVLESPELFNIISKKKLSLYGKPWMGSWSEIDHIHNLPWKYN